MGKPGVIVSDNETELTSSAVLTFTQDHKVDWRYLTPRQVEPRRAFAESSQGRMRDEGLNEHLFLAMNHARTVIRGWATSPPQPSSPSCAHNGPRRRAT